MVKILTENLLQLLIVVPLLLFSLKKQRQRADDNTSPVLCTVLTPPKAPTDYQLNSVLKFEIWVTHCIFRVCLFEKRRIKVVV